MNATVKGTGFFSRQPLSAYGKLTLVSLIVSGILCTAFSFLIKNSSVTVLGILLLAGAALVAAGLRWAPLLGSILGVVYLYIFLTVTSYPIYHLQHPKDFLAAEGTTISYISFVVIVLILGCFVSTLIAGIVATVQNYPQGERRASRSFAPVLAGLVGIVIGFLLLGALVQPSATTAATTGATTASTNGVPTVHLGPTNFDQSSVTIAKGSKLMLVDDGSFLHILSNGSWQNGQPQIAREAGAPAVNNVQVDGKSVEIGPFNTAGTYHIYCSVHQGMNLTVIVQ
jgi:plastocyanin